MASVPGEVPAYRSVSQTLRTGVKNHAHDHAPAEANGYDFFTPLSQQGVHPDRPSGNGHTTLQNSFPPVYELSEDRRKKRKISLEPVLHSGQSSPSRAGAEIRIEEVSSLDQPSKLLDDELSDTVTQLHGNRKGPDVSSQIAAPVPKPRRRGRPPKATTKDVQTTLPLCSATNSIQTDTIPSGTSQPKISPGKAIMKIGANGKLFNSSSSPPSNTSPKTSKVKALPKSTSGGKNLILKNGRLAQKLVVTLRYRTSSPSGISAGTRINEILSHKPHKLQSQGLSSVLDATTSQAKSSSRSTHPFFLAKAAQQQSGGLESAVSLHGDPEADAKKPVAWKDLGFKSNRASGFKDSNPENSIWAPLQYQHVGAPQRLLEPTSYKLSTNNKQKSKTSTNRVTDHENILSSYAHQKMNTKTLEDGAMPAGKLRCTAVDVLLQQPQHMGLHKSIRALSTIRNKVLESNSAFDRAEASGPYPWAQQYSPRNWEEVLQSTSYALFEWLSRLAVHNVKQGLDTKQTKQAPKRRKRLKKRNDEFSDFIDFEDEPAESTKIKNAILLVGPSGCGKTASVFTVAKQLGFEVFEIHSGMRRSQRDIFEKVGDMTQNHMVQAGQTASRDSSVPHDTDLSLSQDETIQPSLASFLVPPGKKVSVDTSRSATPQGNKQSQKQSLILFEEVDHVFEDDRGFWSGVQALIQNSKRPVVLTCNDVQNVPLDELDLHTTLVYTAPPVDLVTEYLCYMAAAEGHVIQPDAIRSLYESKGCDLRATITELQFWCQMTVGSTQGGLDWFPTHRSRTTINAGPTIRTFSADTFRTGLDLLPVSSLDLEEKLKYTSHTLDVPCDTFLDLSRDDGKESAVQTTSIQQVLDFLESRSDAECMHLDAQPVLYSTLAAAVNCATRNNDRSRLTEAKIRHNGSHGGETTPSFRCLDALAVENSIHSLGNTRLAPSLDSPRSVLACDIAPYIRSTAGYDQRLEQQRDETFSSQGKKSRTTRAARAAAEGGDKASTRRERWFPESLNLQAVLETGNNWPQWPCQGDTGSAMDTDVMEQD